MRTRTRFCLRESLGTPRTKRYGFLDILNLDAFRLLLYSNRCELCYCSLSKNTRTKADEPFDRQVYGASWAVRHLNPLKEGVLERVCSDVSGIQRNSVAAQIDLRDSELANSLYP
jgi:hypothetical protein